MRVRVCARVRAHLLITGYAKGEPFNADAGIARERAICKRQQTQTSAITKGVSVHARQYASMSGHE